MAFVRRKRIAGHVYLYRVENRWEGGRVRQVVLEYLGAEDPVRRKRAQQDRAAEDTQGTDGRPTPRRRNRDKTQI